MAQPGALELEQPRRSPRAPAGGTAGAEGGARQTITLAVENMTCGGCMRKVEKALIEVPGVASARANLSARRATVVFEEAKANAAPLVDALGRIGFKAAELAPEALDSGAECGAAASEPSRRGGLRRRQYHAAFGVGLVRLRPMPTIPSTPCFIGSPPSSPCRQSPMPASLFSARPGRR